MLFWFPVVEDGLTRPPRLQCPPLMYVQEVLTIINKVLHQTVVQEVTREEPNHGAL